VKFVLFVEGTTEKLGLPEFLGRWMNDPKHGLPRRVGFNVVAFDGCPNLEKKSTSFAESRLSVEGANEIIAVIGIMDLHGSSFNNQSLSVNERTKKGQLLMEKAVGKLKFRQHFAVHDVEAWLLSDPRIFPEKMQGDIKRKPRPEMVNGRQPPGKYLESIYHKHGESYRKALYGAKLFAALDPNIAYAKCPHLKMMLDDMLKLAQSHSQ
jgi:hypothetical protein